MGMRTFQFHREGWRVSGFWSAAALIVFAVGGCAASADQRPGHYQGEMAGEVTATSAILQSRLTELAADTESQTIQAMDIRGRAGEAWFEVAGNPLFLFARRTQTLHAQAVNDYIVKAKIEGLTNDARYYYRLMEAREDGRVVRGPRRSFRTPPGDEGKGAVRLAVVTGMHYYRFHDGPDAYEGPDKHLGYPALTSIVRDDVDVFISTGDSVYYDHPRAQQATTPQTMRRWWREQFIQPRFVALFSRTATMWEKDDHDFRYNDCDLTGDRLPLSDLGIAMFREQVPVVDPQDADAPTYRTHRLSRDLQIWLIEGRDYRSANDMPDGPDKTLWGTVQRDWLRRTLKDSDATFKLIISPTPMIGPDDAYKRDNHTNHDGFRYEGESFFGWAKAQGLLERGLYLVCGDRHWQYHSVRPDGFEEFSTGALVDANARLGRTPGDPKSTDPDAEIVQPYSSTTPSGGYLLIDALPAKWGKAARLRMRFKDEHGEVLHEVVKE